MNQNSNSYLAEAPVGKLMMKFGVPCIVRLYPEDGSRNECAGQACGNS